MPRPRPRAYSASVTTPRTTSNRPAVSAALGRVLASATSATPVTTKASAVLNDIGFWLPKRKMPVARTYQAAITVRPTAAHTRPPALVIASGTRPLRDGVPAGPAGAAECGTAGASAGAGRTSSAPRISVPPIPPRRSNRRARGGLPVAPGPACANHHEILTRFRQARSREPKLYHV